MTTRTVNLAIIAYESPKGEHKYGFKGDEVDVKDDGLDRFDELNTIVGPDVEAALASVVKSDRVGPHPLDHGAGAREVPEEDEELEEDDEPPANRATLAEWQAYAESVGVATEKDDGTAKTKKELIAETTEDD